MWTSQSGNEYMPEGVLRDRRREARKPLTQMQHNEPAVVDIHNFERRTCGPHRSQPQRRSSTLKVLLLFALLCAAVGFTIYACEANGAPLRFALVKSSGWRAAVWPDRGDAVQGLMWTTLHRVSRNRGSPVRIMFLGDSITDGAAEGTLHPRFHPNGSCSFRFPFFRLLSSTTAMSAASVMRATDFVTVGPFSTNCGDIVIPARCFAGLPGETELGGTDRWVRHAGTSGVTAYGLVHARETWSKRVDAYKNSGLMDAPDVAEEVHQMEIALRPLFEAQHKALSDVAVWSAVYRPDLVVVLLGTNDIRHSHSPAEIVGEYLPEIVKQVLTYSNGAEPLAERRLRLPSNASRCTTFVAVVTLFPRAGVFAENVTAFNRLLLDIRLRRKHSSAVAVCQKSWDESSQDMPLELVLVCHPCVRVLDTTFQGGVLGAAEDGTSTFGSEAEFVKAMTFDGLHPNDAGEEWLAARLADAIRNA